MSKKLQKLINIWGIKINLFSLDEFVDSVEMRIKNNEIPIHITGVNPETVVHASKDEFMRKAILNSDFVNIDNAFIVMTLRVLGYRVPERVATPDLFEKLLVLATKNHYNVFILGARENILNRAIENIKNDYPSISIKGHHGYYPRDKEQNIINEIEGFKTDMLFIAFPSPEKESFILKYKSIINTKLMLGVGGAIDCRGELIKRAPAILRNNGFEGIHRSLQNPLYYGKRYFTFYPKFLKIVFRQKNVENE